MYLFISDLHLDTQRPAITQAFYHFMETKVPQAERLYILGDFFEIWLGDDDDTPLYQEVMSCLALYSQNTPIYFMHGNRDFLVGKTFTEKTGVQLLTDAEVIEHGETKILLMHGDSLCTKDKDYMQFREIARSTQWQQNFLGQSIEDRRGYAQKVRAASKTMNSSKPADIMDVTPSEVIRVMEEHQVKVLLHGHTHRPDTHSIEVNKNPAKRIVLGDWNKKGWYASLNNNDIKLESFDI